MARLLLGAVSNISINGYDARRAWINDKVVWMPNARWALSLDRYYALLNLENEYTDYLKLTSDRNWSFNI